MKKSLSSRFELMWTVLEGPCLDKEVRFHPKRMWRFDYANPIAMVAIEIDGGTYCRGRHVRPAGFQADAEKRNSAQLLGWDVYHLTGKMITIEQVQPIVEACQKRLAKAQNEYL